MRIRFVLGLLLGLCLTLSLGCGKKEQTPINTTPPPLPPNPTGVGTGGQSAEVSPTIKPPGK